MRKMLLPAAAVLLTAGGHSALAQQMKYCDNNLVATSFYSNVASNGKTAEVTYHGLFQNQDTRRRVVTAVMPRMSKVGGFTTYRAINNFELAPYQQKDINLFAVSVENPAGTGAPKPASIGSAIFLVCTYR